MKTPLPIPETRETAIPAREKVKFYQVGSYAVGNRLADEDNRSVQSDPNRFNSLTSGHRACQGCGEALGARYALDAAMEATDGDMVVINATGCLEVFSTPYPETSWTIPWAHSLFGNAAAVASGAAAALAAKGKKTRVIAQGGDGGTVDIGMGCVSGMFDRNDDVLFICYDNQAYMNTGVQRSGATPPTARTATTQPVGPRPGNIFGQGKDMARIAMAHEIPYVATATVADLRDLEYKVKRAMEFHGARYIHVLVPCPLGWGSASNKTISIARMATQSGLFPVYEAIGGEIASVMKIRRPVPVTDYLKAQRRFAHLFKPEPKQEVLDRLQAVADRNIRRYGLVSADGLDEDVLERIIHADEDPEGRYSKDVIEATQTSLEQTSRTAMAPESARGTHDPADVEAKVDAGGSGVVAGDGTEGNPTKDSGKGDSVATPKKVEE